MWTIFTVFSVFYWPSSITLQSIILDNMFKLEYNIPKFEKYTGRKLIVTSEMQRRHLRHFKEKKKK